MGKAYQLSATRMGLGFVTGRLEGGTHSGGLCDLVVLLHEDFTLVDADNTQIVVDDFGRNNCSFCQVVIES